EYAISKVALLPMGEGDFIMPLKAAVRKAIRKQKGAKLIVELELDKAVIRPPKELMDCLADEPAALAHFNSLPRSHQNYFGNWVQQAKTAGTRAKRIACVVTAMSRKLNFAEMLRSRSEGRDLLFPK
ncbi:MAG TPA: YdeI/OmpD-associated family protein, partial [Puia sp.]|nr:YdeI/OmpD-associated family protein [Puia sp.]